MMSGSEALKTKNVFEFADHPTEPNTSEVVWSESSMVHSARDFPRYNPDDLIGRKGYGIYRKMMLDEQVKAVVRFKRDAIIQRGHTFVIDSDEIDKDEKKRRINLFKTITRKTQGSFVDGLNGILSGIYQGFSITEKVHKQIKFEGLTYWGIKRLRVKPFDSFFFEVDDFGNVERLMQDIGGKRQEIDIDSVIHYVQNPEYDEQYGQSELREAYRSWYCKDIIIKFQNIFMERHASGLIVAKPKDGKVLTAGTTEYNNLINALNNIQTKTSLLLPSGIDLDLHSPKNNVAYEAAIAQHDKSIAKALLVPNLLGITEQGKAGSFAQSKTQFKTFLWTVGADSIRLEEALNEQLFMPLGEINFLDGITPRFKFKELSRDDLLELIDRWGDLTGKRTVVSGDEDEEYIRDLMGFPNKTEGENEEAPQNVDPTTALNGAQVSSLLDVITSVAEKRLPRESAVEIISNSFPVSRDQADKILGEVGKGFKPKSAIVPIKNSPLNNEDDIEPVDKKIPDLKKNENEEDEENKPVGFSKVSRGAFSKALKRIDFAVINDKSNKLLNKHTKILSDAMGVYVSEMVKIIRKKDLAGNDADATIIAKLNPPKGQIAKIREILKSALQSGWDMGGQFAAVEITKAGGTFSKHFKSQTLQDQSAQYFEAKTSYMTGNLTNDAQAIINNTLTQGIKYSKSVDQIIDEIYSTMASRGMISREDAEKALGEQLEIKNPTARLKTVIRTNMFDAINEARFSFFNDPELEGFVEALEYTSILDSRTTDICRHLNETVYPVDSDSWDSVRPPNHYNCRSLLIAVTVNDEWSESAKQKENDPKPNQGFG